MMDWLNVACKGAGSVTLVTTSKLGVFHELKKAEVEKIPLISKTNSRDLFRTHAFPKGSLWLDSKILVVAKNVHKECRCLPLALKVVGFAMRDETSI